MAAPLTEEQWLDGVADDQRFVDTSYVCEATDDEVHALWWKWSEHYLVPWNQESMGVGRTIGNCDRRPVAVAVAWNMIGPARVAFVTSTSQVTDWEMFRDWQNVVFQHTRERSNATNFGHIIAAIEKNNDIQLFDRRRVDWIERALELDMITAEVIPPYNTNLQVAYERAERKIVEWAERAERIRKAMTDHPNG